MEISSLDLDKYAAWFFERSDTFNIETTAKQGREPSINRTGYPSKDQQRELLDNAARIRHDEGEILINNLVGFAHVAPEFAFYPTEEEQDEILETRDTHLEKWQAAYLGALDQGVLSKKALIESRRSTLSYTFATCYTDPLKPLFDLSGERERFSFVSDFAKDWASYRFAQFLNTEQDEDTDTMPERDEVEPGKLTLPEKICLLETVGFFELPEWKKIRPTNQHKILALLLGEKTFDNTKQYVNALHGSTKRANPKQYTEKINRILAGIFIEE